MKADIYLIKNKLNNKLYVGQSIKGYLNRWRIHCFNARHPNKYTQYIDRALHKYGIDNFELILLDTVDINEKDFMEQYYIKKYNSLYPNGYNKTIGGDYNPMNDKRVRYKHKLKMNQLEIREKISKSVKKTYTPELKQWFSNHSKNIWNNWSDEQRANCIKGILQRNINNRVKIAALNKDESIFKIFDSASDACIYFGRARTEAGNLLRVCDKYRKDGKRASHYGYYWIRL